MTYLKIELLTPVHIGTGRKLEANLDFIWFGGDDQTVAILDERKVFSVIGPENLETWLTSIKNRTSLLPYLRTRRPGLQPSDVAARELEAPGEAPNGRQDIREQMRAGNGEALLPGSSLKGALRTAWLTARILAKPVESRYALPRDESGLKRNFSDLDLTQLHLLPTGVSKGKAPNHDLLRLLQVGDAHFATTWCLLTETLNERGNEQEMKHNVAQFTECLASGQSGLARVQVPTSLKAQLLEKNQVRTTDGKELTIPSLLSTVRQHTSRLLQQELDKYKDLNLPREADEFVQSLVDLQQKNEACADGRQAVLRLGFGSGHAFITGGWYKEVLKSDPQKQRELENAARKNNRYEGIPLSKSRKMTLNGIPLGFVRLTLLTEAEAQAATALARAAAETVQKQDATEAAAVLAAAEAAVAEAAVKAEQARLPQYFQGKLKQGAEIDAVVEKFAAPNATLRLYIGSAGLEQMVSLRYPGGLAVGTVCVVRVQAEQKGKVQAVLFVREKK